MIQDKILDNQVGIAYQGEQDLSETMVNRLMNTGVLIGKFKRGFVGKPFVVLKGNFQRLLGYDPSNDDYKAVEDFFASSRGNSLVIIRTGSPKQKVVTKPIAAAISTPVQPISQLPPQAQPTSSNGVSYINLNP